MGEDLAHVEKAGEADALGYVLKEEAGTELVLAIRPAEGERYINRKHKCASAAGTERGLSFIGDRVRA
jgi:hypothetical protein